MWLIDYLPVWVFHLVFAAGIAGFTASYLLKMVPFFGSNASTVRVISAAVVALMLWIEGGLTNELKWQERVKVLQDKMALIEKQSEEATKAIDERVAQKQQELKDRQVTLVQFIDREVTKYDEGCKIPKDFTDVINQAAEQLK